MRGGNSWAFWEIEDLRVNFSAHLAVSLLTLRDSKYNKIHKVSAELRIFWAIINSICKYSRLTLVVKWLGNFFIFKEFQFFMAIGRMYGTYNYT